MLQWLRRLFQGPAKDATPQQAPRPEDDAPQWKRRNLRCQPLRLPTRWPLFCRSRSGRWKWPT